MSMGNVIIFWDYASTHALSASAATSTYDLTANIRSACLELGTIKSFRAYGNFSSQGPRASTVHSELLASGVTVVDFPDIGRKEAGVKMMVVDMITHAWDYPTDHTHVIVTCDRDLSYAVAMLRMRHIKVVLISSITAHPDLSAHASVNLDWSKTVLGYQNSTSRFVNSFESKSPPVTPSSSHQTQTERLFGSQNQAPPAQQQDDVKLAFEPESVELRDISPRGRRHSVFSVADPRTFEGFRNIGDPPLTPKIQRGLFGFGDGPLFTRQDEERHRAESVPPHRSESSTPSEHANFQRADSKGKGKTRAHSMSEESPSAQQPADVPYSGSVFGPSTTNGPAYSSIPKQEAPVMSASSSSSTSQSTVFSVIQKPDTTAVTSTISDARRDFKAGDNATRPFIFAAEYTVPPSTKATKSASHSTSRRNSTPTIESPQGVDLPKEVLQRFEPVAGPSNSSPNVLPTTPLAIPTIPKPTPVVAKPQPQSIFQTLITVLRREGPVARSVLAIMLVKQDARVYDLAGIPQISKKFQKYISAAKQAGVISESGDTVKLLPQYEI